MSGKRRRQGNPFSKLILTGPQLEITSQADWQYEAERLSGWVETNGRGLQLKSLQQNERGRAACEYPAFTSQSNTSRALQSLTRGSRGVSTNHIFDRWRRQIGNQCHKRTLSDADNSGYQRGCTFWNAATYPQLTWHLSSTPVSSDWMFPLLACDERKCKRVSDLPVLEVVKLVLGENRSPGFCFQLNRCHLLK